MRPVKFGKCMECGIEKRLSTCSRPICITCFRAAADPVATCSSCGQVKLLRSNSRTTCYPCYQRAASEVFNADDWSAYLVEKMKDVEPDRRGCLEWPGSMNAAGYGTANFNGHSTGAHRAAFFAYYEERPISCHHECRNRACLNPLHLASVSGRENSAESQEVKHLRKVAARQHDQLLDISARSLRHQDRANALEAELTRRQQ